jgi:hypothetical protein
MVVKSDVQTIQIQDIDRDLVKMLDEICYLQGQAIGEKPKSRNQKIKELIEAEVNKWQDMGYL